MATRLEAIADAIHTRLADATIGKFVDAVGLEEHDQLRRIVWVALGGDFGPPSVLSGRQPSGSSPTTGTRVAIAKMRRELVNCHLYADTRENLELLLEELVRTLTKTFATVELKGYRWVTQEPGNSGRNLRSEKCVLTFVANLPVVETSSPLRPVVSHSVTASIGASSVVDAD